MGINMTTSNDRCLDILDRLSLCLFYPALVLIFLRPSWLKFHTPLGRVSVTSAQNVVIAFCLIWFLAFLLNPRRYFTPGAVGGPLLSFLTANFISAVLSPFGSLSERLDAVMEIVLYGAFFYASLYVFRTSVDGRRVVRLLFIAAVVVAVVDVSYHYHHGMWKMIDRGYPFWDGKNALGLFMVLALSMSAALLARPGDARTGSGWRSAVILPGLFAMFLCAVYSYSRGAWVALIGAAVLFALLRSWRLVALLAVAVMALAYLPHGRALKRFASIAQMRDRNVEKRLVVWKDALLMIRARPLVGVGPGEFRNACRRFERAADTRSAARAPQEKLIYRDHAHNLALQVGAESGILGLLALGWAGAAVFQAVCARMRNASDPAARSMAQCIAAALVAFLIFSLTDCSWTGRFSGSSFMHVNFIVVLMVAMLYAIQEPKLETLNPKP